MIMSEKRDPRKRLTAAQRRNAASTWAEYSCYHTALLAHVLKDEKSGRLGRVLDDELLAQIFLLYELTEVVLEQLGIHAHASA